MREQWNPDINLAMSILSADSNFMRCFCIFIIILGLWKKMILLILGRMNLRTFLK